MCKCVFAVNVKNIEQQNWLFYELHRVSSVKRQTCLFNKDTTPPPHPPQFRHPDYLGTCKRSITAATVVSDVNEQDIWRPALIFGEMSVVTLDDSEVNPAVDTSYILSLLTEMKNS